jgi:hypothetical protein
MTVINGIQFMMPVDKVKKGTLLRCDDGFTCIRAGTVVKVRKDSSGLWIPCREGRHYLDGQLNDSGSGYVGFT